MWLMMVMMVMMVMMNIIKADLILQVLNEAFGNAMAIELCYNNPDWTCGSSITLGYASEWNTGELDNINFMYVKSIGAVDRLFGSIYVWDNDDCKCDLNNNCHFGRNGLTSCILKVTAPNGSGSEQISANPSIQIYNRAWASMRICKNSEACGNTITASYASEWNKNEVSNGDILWYQVYYPFSGWTTIGGLWIWDSSDCACVNNNCNVGIQRTCTLKITGDLISGISISLHGHLYY